ncbi:MAG TPA: Smr/MutS family protein [Thermoanaerobaculia bacterium]|nr:Smr/MutS family protein [Thermoanaerobaculia bacterium]
MTWLDRILGRRAAEPTAKADAHHETSTEGDEDPELERGLESDEPDAVVLSIEDAIDLHPFHPREIRDVVRGYLDEAWERGFEEVRIIHGRGIGQQREAVRRLLELDPRIASFADAGADRGGWGATVARFAPRDDTPDPDADAAATRPAG